ncbi:Transcriptional regulator, AbiEi antitoxin, Type IV TA system [Jiangella alkaliphila]|uniref:Transcriptional regulator, AbiEi antitoxin, Type IV TA system n=2 Tax=Jiangella alkaliphila TaxID=419479 RepID=A0A1H2M2M7_9ACTN|nr:Transcriptional regulator, AbiEi antitoxin, Type IV TA system [Jiangella alkaliphila]
MGSRLTCLPPDVTELLRAGAGLIHTSAAAAGGVTAGRLSRLVDAGLLVRLGPGSYTSAEVLRRADPAERHTITARAFARRCGPDVYLTEWSAAATWRLPATHQYSMPPAVARPCAPGRGATSTPGGRILVSRLPEEHCRTVADVGVMSPAWAVCTLATTAPVIDALIAADSAVRSGADLDDALRQMGRWPGKGRARWVATHADPCAETPIETLGRFTCIEFGLPMPVANAWVGADQPEYRVDGLWPFHWAVFEADGAIKYDNRPDASRIVARQVEREWRLRRLGLDVARFGWNLAFRRRGDLAQRFQALLAANHARSAPVRWWKDVPGIGPAEPRPDDWPSPAPTSIELPAGWERPAGRPR